MQDTAISAERIKAYLQSFSDDSKALALMQERLSNLESKTGSPRASNLTGMPRGPADPIDTIGRQVSALEVLRDAVTDAEAQLARKRQRVEAVINILHEKRVPRWPEKVNCLNLRYIDDMKWDDVAEVIFGTSADFWDNPDKYRARTMQHHRQGLQELAELCPLELLDECEEITESGS